MDHYIATDRSHEIIRSDLSAYHLTTLQNRRLLVVDDDPDLWPLVLRAGHIVDPDLEIYFAASTLSAIDRMLEPMRFDAVLVDDCLPRAGDGLSLCSSIESLQPWAEIAMMSGISRLEDADCLFLRKPFSPTKCWEFLRELLA